MGQITLSANDILELLKEDNYRTTGYAAPIQQGPLRRFEKEMRCANKYKRYSCGSPTHFKVNGIPKCMIHALHDLNQMLVERGVGIDN